MTDHNQIVELAKRIAEWDQKARSWRMRAASLRSEKGLNSDADAEIFEREASSIDDDICQLCVEMKLLCGSSDSALRTAALAYIGVNRSQGVTDEAYEKAEAALDAALNI
jgi:hypothetical protein